MPLSISTMNKSDIPSKGMFFFFFLDILGTRTAPTPTVMIMETLFIISGIFYESFLLRIALDLLLLHGLLPIKHFLGR